MQVLAILNYKPAMFPSPRPRDYFNVALYALMKSLRRNLNRVSLHDLLSVFVSYFYCGYDVLSIV
jgi:hypothetical protein